MHVAIVCVSRQGIGHVTALAESANKSHYCIAVHFQIRTGNSLHTLLSFFRSFALDKVIECRQILYASTTKKKEWSLSQISDAKCGAKSMTCNVWEKNVFQNHVQTLVCAESLPFASGI